MYQFHLGLLWYERWWVQGEQVRRSQQEIGFVDHQCHRQMQCVPVAIEIPLQNTRVLCCYLSRVFEIASDQTGDSIIRQQVREASIIHEEYEGSGGSKISQELGS